MRSRLAFTIDSNGGALQENANRIPIERETTPRRRNVRLGFVRHYADDHEAEELSNG